MDKINEAIGLAKRIHNEIDCGNLDNALYLTDTFVFLFSDHKKAKDNLVASYTAASQNLLDGGQLEKAEALTSKGLQVDPRNSALSSIFMEIKKRQHQILRSLGRRSIKEVVHELVKKHFPRELPLFDLAWRIFKDIRPEDFSKEAVSGALGIVGGERADLNTPQAIILLNHLALKKAEELPEEEVKELVSNIGRVIGCSQELMDKVIDSLLKA